MRTSSRMAFVVIAVLLADADRSDIAHESDVVSAPDSEMIDRLLTQDRPPR